MATRQISRYWQSRNEKKRIPPALEYTLFRGYFKELWEWILF